MNSRKKGIVASLILMVMLVGSTALAASVSNSHFNTSNSYYYYSESGGTSSMTAIGGSGQYITQGFNHSGVSKVVYSYISVVNEAGGFSQQSGKAQVINQTSAPCVASLSHTFTSKDFAYHVVEKYNSTSVSSYISSPKIDEIVVDVYNIFN